MKTLPADSGAKRIFPIAIGGRAFTRIRGRTICYARKQMAPTEIKLPPRPRVAKNN